MCALAWSILIVIGFVWFISKFDKPSDSKSSYDLIIDIKTLKQEFKKEISALKERISQLEAEIRLLKGDSGEVTSKEPVITEIAEVADIVESQIPDTESTSSKISGIDNELAETQKDFSEIYHHTVESTKAEIIETEEKTVPEECKPVKQEKSPAPKIDFESFIAGNILNKIGALALIIGMGFFLKYAFDQNWISPAVQVLVGILVSFSLIFGASHFNKKEDFKIFSQGLAGAGIAILYLSIFAAYSFYNLIDYPVAIISLSLATALAFFQALKYDSIAVAMLGLVGGFLTPFILDSGSKNITGVLIYLIFLNSWIIALLYKKDHWRPVEITSILVSYVTYFSFNPGYSNMSLVIGILITVIWLLFFGLDISRAARRLNEYTVSRFISNSLNILFYYFAIEVLINSRESNILGLISLLIAAIYLLVVLIANKKWHVCEQFNKQNLLTSIILLIFSTGILFDGFTKIIFWALESLIVLWYGIKYDKVYLWKSSIWLLTFSSICLLFNNQALSYTPLNNFIPVLNFRTFTFVIISGITILSIKILDKVKNEDIKWAQSLLNCSWCTLLFILFTVEINDFMTKLTLNAGNDVINQINFNKSMIHVIVWIMYSVQLIKYGLKKTVMSLVYCGFICMLIAIVHLLCTGYSYIPLERFIPVLNLRFLAFLLVIAGILFVSNILKNYQDKYTWSKTLQKILTYSWCIIFFILLNCEINDFFAQKMYLSASLLQSVVLFNKNMLMGIIWTLFSLPLIKTGLKNNDKPLVLFGGGLISLTLFVELFKGYAYIPAENFVFLLNNRMFSFAVLIGGLYLVTKWLKKLYKDSPDIVSVVKIIQVSLSLLIFYVLTIEIKDMFAKEIILSGSGDISMLNNIKQLTYSGIWLIYSIFLMVWGILKKIKVVRYVSFGILGLTILKIFIIDLSFLNQLYRIISFIGLGVITEFNTLRKPHSLLTYQ